MAKRRSRRRSRSRSARKHTGKLLNVHPHFNGKTYDCRGKRVKNARGSGTHPRVYCSKQDK